MNWYLLTASTEVLALLPSLQINGRPCYWHRIGQEKVLQLLVVLRRGEWDDWQLSRTNVRPVLSYISYVSHLSLTPTLSCSSFFFIFVFCFLDKYFLFHLSVLFYFLNIENRISLHALKDFFSSISPIQIILHLMNLYFQTSLEEGIRYCCSNRHIFWHV